MTKARIVVVEDEIVVARDLQHTLVRLGYEVPATAASGQEALERVAAAQPDLVLMDIHLSGPIDGIEAAEQIRQRHGLPVVFLTAHSDEATFRRAQITEPYGYVLKPFEERELEIAIGMALYRHQVEAKLHSMERWLATTLRSIGDAVIATGIDGLVTLMNPMAETLTGWGQAEALGRPLDEVLRLVHDGDRAPLASLMERLRREDMLIEIGPQTLLLARDGSALPVDHSAAPIRDQAGQVTGFVIVFRDISDRKQLEDQLRHSALHDALTGLANRALLMDRLAYAFEHARRHPAHLFALLYIDLDGFKAINDRLGHLFGDQALVSVARRLEASVRGHDTLARLGGDEFVVLLDEIDGARVALHVAERIQRGLTAAIQLDGHEIVAGASIGIAVYGPSYGQVEDILRDADAALYRAKALGKGRYVLFDAGLHQDAVALLQLETDLRRAVERQEFRVHYQPIVSLVSGQVRGFEALLRWQHPERGLLLPADFLELAEETGQLALIGRWALEQACRQTKAWQAAAPAGALLCLSVNLSPKQFSQPGLVDQVASALAETGLEPARLCLEITEAVITEGAAGLETLRRLDELGVQLHVDDFGAGCLPLGLLHRLPLDALKIDRQFTLGLNGPGGEARAIVRTIVLLARELGLAVVAQGIETAEQADYLKSLACEFGQGFLFGKALAADEVRV